MKKQKFLVFLLFISVFNCQLVNSQDRIKFDYLTTKDGLSTNRVRCIHKDSKGYLWIGTEIGLDKFDSYQIKTYQYSEKIPGSISNNEIWVIFEDSHKNIWVGTNDGLNLYDRDNDSFTVFKNNPSDSTTLDHNKIIGVFEDKNGNIWISTNGRCLNKWVPSKKKFSRYQLESTFGATFLREDSKGNLWVVSKNKGINRFDPRTGKFTLYSDSKFDLGFFAKKIHIDKDDLIWIATKGDGLFTYNPSTNKFNKFGSDGDGKGTNGKTIIDLIEEDQRHLWFAVDPVGATRQGGINCYDKVTRTFEYIVSDELVEGSLNIKGLWGIYKDNEGIIWVCTPGGGLNYYNSKKNKFKFFRHHIYKTNSLSSNIVNCFYEDSEGMIWIGTDDAGFNLFNPKTGVFKSYKSNSDNLSSVSGNTIRCISEDKNKNLWIATWSRGLNCFDRKTNKFYHFMPETNKLSAISGPSIWHFTIDHKEIFWLALFDIGIDLYDRNKGVIKRFRPNPNNPNALSSAKIWYTYQDSRKMIWLCTSNGLNRYDSIHNNFVVYNHFPSKMIKVITEDNDKNLWVGTESGFYQIKPDGTLLQAYDKTNGLAGNVIHGIICDKHGNIWVSTNSGISRFDIKTKTFQNYNQNEGLQDKAFCQGAFLKTKCGEIYFGGFNGFNSFNPDGIRINTTVPPVYITDFQIFNKNVEFGIPGSSLKKQISETKEITLTHLQSVFSFGFIAINYTNPEKNQYAYKMEGLEEEWNYTDATRRNVTYTNLEAGEYIFRVKASNNDGVWNDEGTSIKIIILPPWWGTWWFKTILGLCILVCIVIVVVKFINKIKHLANQTILDERNQLKTLINNIPDLVFIKDQKSRFLVVNNKAVEYLGCKNEKEIINKTDYDFFPEEITDKAIREELEIMTSGIPLLNVENKRTINENVAYFLSTKCPIINLKGETIGLLVIIRNITTQKLAEIELKNSNILLEERRKQIEEQAEELKTQTEVLKEANALLIDKQQLIQQQSDKLTENNNQLSILNTTKDKLFSIIAHDLRNPFNIVIGFSELLVNNYKKLPIEKIEKYLNCIYTSSLSGNDLLNNLLFWSRSQTQSISFNPQELNLSVIIDESINLLVGSALNKNITLQKYVDKELNCIADENMLKTVIRNLISNAIKFTSENGNITIKAEVINNFIQVSVIDTGVGISIENLKKLFQVDSNVSTKGTANESGTGLGLILCKEFIEKQNGKIWVESEEGKGSMFMFTIPLGY